MGKEMAKLGFEEGLGRERDSGHGWDPERMMLSSSPAASEISSSRNIVKSAVSKSTEFNSTCDSTFTHCFFVTQPAFPYQLLAASARLPRFLSSPPVHRWVPSPPSRSQIDLALSLVLRRTNPPPPLPDDPQILGQAEFKQ
ncbi:hypothetical protein CDL15_Pgr025188 [Punica granatum]|uniref:Uncharacterized protein n=1 Tax=Punica granatum TaxID=22663 RepID=A0A218W9V9_PUNGR|nr:hypothetical protein CDL15_Pgr025188 [Punica granatum]PKI40523.1 hypothetical protein CRG98_039083 [Punica granatum]